MGKIGWKTNYCWVVTSLGLGQHPDLTPTITTYETKYSAMLDFATLVEQLKQRYPKIQWKEIGGNPNNNKITEYKVEAVTNPFLYIKAYKSYLE